MMKNKFKSIFFLLFFAYSQITIAQAPPAYIADSLQAMINQSLPIATSYSGAVIEIYVPGKWTWNGAAGFAISGLTSGQPQTTAITTDKFRVGSITKIMMATCILKLQEQGLLNIEDPISMYLRPTFVTDTLMSSGIVKIRHLLNHTSGIANSGNNATCSSTFLANPTNSYLLEESIYCGASLGESFPPESSWEYSNTNYSILAMILQNITGMSWSDYLNQTIITPLGLTNTEIPTVNQIVGSHMGCYWGSSIDITIVNASAYKGWADVVSTTSDLVKFLENLKSGTIINSSSLAQMKTIYPGANQYGLGYDHFTSFGIDFWGHFGEVGNTSALFFVSTTSPMAPNGYYICYNYNIQGIDDFNGISLPILRYLKDPLGSISTLNRTQIENTIYPNPTKSEINIKSIDLTCSSNKTYTLYNELGKIIFQASSLGLTNYTIECSSFNRGIYTLSIENEKNKEFHKIILN